MWSPRPLALALAIAVMGSVALPSTQAHAGDPEPLSASLLGASATLLPIAAGSLLLVTERGETEGFRLGSALTLFAVGATLGPYSGQLYAGGGVDPFVTLVLRTLTTGLTLTGLTFALRGTADDEFPAAALMVFGGIPTVILAGYDIFDASQTAREARIRQVRRNESQELYSVAVCGPIPCKRAPPPALLGFSTGNTP